MVAALSVIVAAVVIVPLDIARASTPPLALSEALGFQVSVAGLSKARSSNQLEISPTPTATSTPTPTSTPQAAASPVTDNAAPTRTPQPAASPVVPTPTSAPAIPIMVSRSLAARSGFAAVAGVNGAVVARMRESGGRMARQTVWWSDVEPTLTSPPTFNWAQSDYVLGMLAGGGIDTIVAIGRNPSWAASTFCGPIDSPGGLAGFAEFVTALAKRYSVAPYNINNWELYNEPDYYNDIDNPYGGISCFGKHPAAYVQLLKTAWQAIKSVDPDARILMGGLAYQPAWALDNSVMFNLDFLEQVIQAGGAPYFDVAAVHYYSSQNSSWVSHGWDIAGKVNSLRAIMARNGVSKSIAVTEVSYTDSLDTDQQAQYVPKMLARGLQLDLSALIWYTLADYPGTDFPYGLLDQHLNERAAYRAFQVAMSEFGTATSIRPLSPNEVGVAGGVEGYVFNVEGQQRWVLWAKDGGAPLTVRLPQQNLAAKDKLGRSIALSTAGTVLLDGSPIYVRFP